MPDQFTKRETVALAMLPHLMVMRSTVPYNTTMRDMGFNVQDHAGSMCAEAFELADAFIWASRQRTYETP